MSIPYVKWTVPILQDLETWAREVIISVPRLIKLTQIAAPNDTLVIMK